MKKFNIVKKNNIFVLNIFIIGILLNLSLHNLKKNLFYVFR